MIIQQIIEDLNHLVDPKHDQEHEILSACRLVLMDCSCTQIRD